MMAEAEVVREESGQPVPISADEALSQEVPDEARWFVVNTYSGY